MKFTINKNDLLSGLSAVHNVVGGRSTLPVLSNVLLEAGDGEIRLTTTDLDLGICRTVKATVTVKGATTLPNRRLLAVVRELSDTEISFDVDSKHLASIKSGASRFQILGIPGEEFPPLAKLNEAQAFI